jgi:hypothetical protein
MLKSGLRKMYGWDTQLLRPKFEVTTDQVSLAEGRNALQEHGLECRPDCRLKPPGTASCLHRLPFILSVLNTVLYIHHSDKCNQH